MHANSLIYTSASWLCGYVYSANARHVDCVMSATHYTLSRLSLKLDLFIRANPVNANGYA